MEIKKNEEYELLIEDMTISGEGVGKIDGYALFVKDAIPGDRIIAKVIKTKKNYGYGRMMRIITPSPVTRRLWKRRSGPTSKAVQFSWTRLWKSTTVCGW